ncbi:hypothetical protein MNBD_UNCLBAC01-160 [hydrothermal vent metagenome]|uniref:Type IV pilus biogenesis protein PilN n=1 Tax=hydrothermal vent metagenome TaxID=652676 RepID=A0A3B1D4B9_9ZZZZ
MIDINLTPPEFKRIRKKSSLSVGINIPLEVVIGLGGGLVFILIMTHVVLLFMNVTRSAKHRDLQKKWNEILPAKENVDVVLKEKKELKNQYNALKNVIDERGIFWAQKLNIISDQLPKEVWLRRIVLDEGLLLIEGSAISRQSKEMINVHKFLANLKGEKKFQENLAYTELGTIQSRKIKKVEIADFLIKAQLEYFEEE